MEIRICGQARAVELAAEAKVPTSVISITSKEDKEVIFSDNPNIRSVLHLKFNDLTAEYDAEGIPYGRPLPKPEDFKGLKEFLTGISCSCLIIHCWEGTSRSAAVAKAVYEFRGRVDDLIPENEIYPNPLVYDLARRELSCSHTGGRD